MELMTNRQTLLVVAARLPEPFSAADLVKAAWEDSPERFSLDPYPLPDSNAVLFNLMGERGMVHQGYLVKVESKKYALSPHGKAEATRLVNGEPPLPKPAHTRPEALPKIQLTEALEADITRLLRSKATLRFRSGQADTLTRADAVSFWGKYSPDEVAAVVESSKGALVGGVVRMRSGQEVWETELARIGEINVWLTRRFWAELTKKMRRLG